MEALEAACDIPNCKQQLQRGVTPGVIDESSEDQEENRVFQVSRFLPHIIPTIRFTDAPEVYSLYQKAHEKLHKLWGNKNNKSEEKWQEIFRLKFANQGNPERFRQGFSEMLAVQYNPQADRAFEGELRKYADDLLKDGLCTQLENYLQQKQWKEADEETAWIFYQVMVKENYEDWDELLENFPCETLREINSLWLQSSNNKFGISIQAEIYQNLGSSSYGNYNWDVFGERVGWKQDSWLSYYKLMEKFEESNVQQKDEIWTSSPSLPALIYTQPNKWTDLTVRRRLFFGIFDIRKNIIFSRAKTCGF
ncbi:GUN4 domain-containing protein [Nostoc flagelliforme FACHB-838]|uniref:GUN4 domain-containing protein n=2 Tax=Nostoc flagelliforme TaxID=1306274 RepID=A0ABR8E3D1_9NOSO|nr:GUN4 domain-containing protein [Nostoc flagelliforme FACHB-838]